MNRCSICGAYHNYESDTCLSPICQYTRQALDKGEYYAEGARWWLRVRRHTIEDFINDSPASYYILDRLYGFYDSFLKAWELNIPALFVNSFQKGFTIEDCSRYVLPLKEYQQYKALKELNRMLQLYRYKDLQRKVLEKFAVIVKNPNQREYIIKLIVDGTATPDEEVVRIFNVWKEHNGLLSIKKLGRKEYNKIYYQNHKDKFKHKKEAK